MSCLKVKIETLVYPMRVGEKNATTLFGVEKPLTVFFSVPLKYESEFSREFFILS